MCSAIDVAMMEWSSSLLIIQETFFQLLHVMDPRMVNPLLKDTKDAVVHQTQIRRIGWPYLWEDELWCFSLAT